MKHLTTNNQRQHGDQYQRSRYINDTFTTTIQRGLDPKDKTQPDEDSMISTPRGFKNR